MIAPKLAIPSDEIERFCRKWKIVELALFGSVVRGDFGPDSDVDVLVTFEPDDPWSYWEWPEMIDELREIFQGREVDLVEKRAIRNPFRRESILRDAQVLYAA